MKKQKMKLVNKERFETFLSMVGLALMVVVFVAIPKQKGTIERWHDACENGTSWNEYVKGE